MVDSRGQTRPARGRPGSPISVPVSPGARPRSASARERAEPHRIGYHRFLEHLEQIDRVIRNAAEPDGMLSEVLDSMLSIFQCDRAWLLYPCDPSAKSYRLPMERTREQYPGALAIGAGSHIGHGLTEEFRIALDTNEPVKCDPRSGRRVRCRGFSILSQILLAVHPRVGCPWAFGMHQCSHARVWTEEDSALFKEIGRRVADGLSSLLFLRDMRASESRYRNLVENINDVIFTLDSRGIITFISPVIEGLTQYRVDEIVGRPFGLFLHPDDRLRIEQDFQRGLSGTLRRVEFRIIGRDGGVRFLRSSSRPLDMNGAAGLSGTLTDITQQKQFEEQLLQAQKMEAVGRLAGGVAHDFNNLLQAMLSQTQLLRRLPTGSPRQPTIVDSLENEVRRGAALARQLLLFSRRGTAKPERLDLNEIICRSLEMLRPLVRENIAMSLDLGGRPLPVEADGGQIEQVLLNLVVNAADAMPQGGSLAIDTGRDDDGAVWVEVRDTGHGISEEIRDRIFEPFFTTKAADKGTGLGLAVVHEIVARHGGRIHVRSTPGEGTGMRVVLPAAGPGPGAAAVVMPSPIGDLPSGHGERVVLVEDEQGAREGLRESLEMLGYEVAAVGSAEDAASLPTAPAFDVLLTDLMLPGASGSELAEVLHARWPRLSVILMSGYSEDDAQVSGAGDGGVRFLQKPFDMATLARAVRAALEEIRSGAD